MPFKIATFTDTETGANYTDTFWWCDSFTLNYSGKVLQVRYVCHLNEQSQTDGKKPLPFTKNFYIAGDDFVTLMQGLAAGGGNPSSPLPVKIAELLDGVAASLDEDFTNAELIPVVLGVLA